MALDWQQVMRKNTRQMGWWAALVLCGLLVFLPGLRGKYFMDDFFYYFDPLPSNVFYYFWHPNPYTEFYRPLQATFIVIVQKFFGDKTLPVHLTQLFMHILLAGMVYHWMLRNRFTEWQSRLGSLFMVVTQAGATAVLGNDTFSQLSGAIFGWAALWLFYEANGDTAQDRNRRIVSAFLFTLALLSKETVVGFFFLTLLIAWGRNATQEGWRRMTRPFAEVLPYLLMLAMYLGMRFLWIGASGVAARSDRYGFQFGPGVLKNLVEFLVSILLPGSTVNFFVAMQQHAIGTMAFLAASTVVCGLFLLTGSRQMEPPRLFYPALGTVLLASLTPVIFLNHVSELYIYNALPVAAVLFGSAAGNLLENRRFTQATRFGLAGVTVLLLAGNALASRSKAVLMAQNGERATLYLRQVVPYLAQIPTDGTLYLINPSLHPIKYSVLRADDLWILDDSQAHLYQLSRRPDIHILLAPPSEREKALNDPLGLVLTLDEDGRTIRRIDSHRSRLLLP